MIREISPDRGTNTYEYDAAGRMTKSTDGRGQVVNYTHDILGRVTQMVPVGRPASEVIAYHWDTGGLAGSYSVGRLAKVVDGSGTTLFQYDHRGNQTVQQQVIGTSTAAQLAYSFDLADRITQITYPSGRQVRYGYDTLGRVGLVETRASAATPTWQVVASGHQYEPFGPVKAMALGNGLAVSNDWGTDGFLAERRLVATSSGAALSHLAYGRDEVGRIGAIADQLTPANSVLYGYDPVGRLTMAVSSSGSAASETYAYNPGTNQLASVTDASGTRTVSYDGRGNTVAETRPGGISVAASYDGHARLESYDRTNIGAQTYSYNGLGDRVRVVKPTGTRHFVYDSQGRVVAEYDASSAEVKVEFIWALPPAANDNSPFGGDDGIVGYAPLALVTTNTSSQLTLYWVHGNQLGVPMVTTNALGQVVDPGNDFLRPGFPGQSQVLSDLYYNRARDYDSVLGRYIQADPIGLLGGANPYLYANGDPVNLIDPSGENPLVAIIGRIIIAGLIGAGTDLAFQGIDNYRRGRRVLDRNCYDWNSVAISFTIGAVGGGIGRIGATAGEGLEFSHAIPGRFFRPLTLSGKNLNPEYKPLLDKLVPKSLRNSRWNGNYVPKRFHAWTDPHRYLRGQTKADTLAAPWRHLLRIPTIYAYPAAGAGVVVNSVVNEN